MKVSVWWDFQSCHLPQGANPCRVATRVTAALRDAGIRGPVDITALGDAYMLPRAVQEALAATGVAFSHVPSSFVFQTHPNFVTHRSAIVELINISCVNGIKE